MGVTAGTWNDGGDLAPTTSYQWQISSDLLTWTSVSGATSSTYTPVPGQVGSYLRAQVTRTNSLGSTSVINAAPSAGAQNSIAAWSNTGTISTSSSNTPSANWQVNPSQLASSCSLTNTFLANNSGWWRDVFNSPANSISFTFANDNTADSVTVYTSADLSTSVIYTPTNVIPSAWTDQPTFPTPATRATHRGGPVTATISVPAGSLIYGLRIDWGAGGVLSTTSGAIDCRGISGMSIMAYPKVQAGISSAPQSVVAAPASASAVISWSAPATNNGSPITGYTVTSSPGNLTCTTTGATSCTVSGLTNGTAYTFAVTATNGVGTSVAATTGSVTPAQLSLSGASTFVTTTGVNASSGTYLASGGYGTKRLTYVVTPSNSGITLDTSTSNQGVINVSSAVPAGVYIETITATDSASATTTLKVTITVNGPIVETATTYALTTTFGRAAVDTVFATSGSGNKAFTFIGNPTHAGITLDTSTAASGYARLNVSAAVPIGLYYDTVTVTDSVGATASVVITVLVNSPPVLTATYAGTITIDSGTVFVDTFTTSSGTTQYTYTLSSNPANSGITLDTSTSGIAVLRLSSSVIVGTYWETITVTDAARATDSETVQINVVYPRVITQPATCTPDSGFTNCIYVGYTGKVQSYALPSYLVPGLPLQIEEWGAGGGGSYYTTGWTGSNGGAAGGYTKATHTIINSGETLTVLVGEGGSSQQTVRTFGGGGAGGNGNGGQTGSNGGGLTGVYFGSDTSTPLLISGGGGGASPGDAGGGYVAGGGGAAGNSGSTGGSTDVAGNSGTLLAGGAAATSYSGCSVPPTSGSRNQGGSGAGGAGVEGGGGGGGGYYGGGGGTCQGGQQNGGGGGGSGYVSPSSIQIITATNGGNGTQGYVTPGGNTSTQYKLNAGRGGYHNCGTVACSKAGDGLVVIQWNANLPVISFDSNSATSGTSPTSITEVDTITVTLPGNTGTLLKNGFTAVRWNTLANGTGTSYSFGDSLTTTSNVKLYAQYGATLKFDLNGGTGATPSDILRYDTNTFVLPNIDSSTFAFTGLTFTSWNTRADGTGTFYRSGDTVTLTPTGGVQTLYAYWAGPLAATGSTGTTLKTTVTIATSETITALNGTGAKRFALTSSSNMNGGITLDTTTAASGFVVLNVSSSTPVDTYTETVTITDAVGSTVRFVVTVRVNNFPTFASGIIQNGLILHVDAANPLSEIGTGSTWYDLSGNGKNFTLAGSPTYTTNSAGALNFDGSTQYAYNATTTTLANFTASVWAKSNIIPPTGSYSPLSAYWNGANLNYSIYFNGSGTLYGGFNTSSTWYQTSASFAPTPGVWYQYTVSYDGAAVRLYVNGVQLSSFATTATAATGGGVYIGSNWVQGGKWNGSIGNVQVYNRALAATDVFNNFAVNAPHYISGTSGTTTYSLSQSGPTVTPTYTVGQGTDTKTISVSPTIAGLTPTISGNTIFFTLGNGLAAGTYNETITAIDSVGAATNYLATFTVTGSIVESATSTNVVLDSVQSFMDTVTVNGGVGPYTFTLSSSLASSGITLDTSTASSKYVRLNFATGVASGTYLETITATDANGISTYILITVTINAPPFLTHPDGQNGVGMTPTNYSNSILKTGLAVQLDFNNTSTYSGTGTTINSLVGTISGSTTNSPVYTATGGGYFTLDGVSGLNKEISTSSGSATTGNISQFAWIYPTADGVITTEYNSNGWIYQNMYILGGKLWVQFYQGTAHTSTLSVPFNQWNYVGYTYDGTTIKSYINGQLAGTSTSTRSAPPSDQWGIGLGYNSLPYGNFRIGSFHVYSTTLSTLDVQKNFVYTEPRFDSVGVTVLQTTAGIPISKSGYAATSGTGNKSIAISPSVSGASIDTSTVNYATYNLAGSVAAGSVLQRLTATDQVGVNSQYNVLAIVNPAMTLSAAALVETTTVGAAIGPDTVTVTGGTRTFSFSLTGSPTTTGFSLNSISETQTSLVVANTVPAGTYYETITVTDSVSATASIVIKVVVNGALSLSANSSTVNVNFGATASDTVTVSGGTSPFSFALNSSFASTGITLDTSLASSGKAVVKFASTVPVGTYYETVTATDAYGQTSTMVMTFFVDATVNFNINGGTGVTPSSITQVNNGLITLPDSTGFSKAGFTFTGWVDSGTILNFPTGTVNSYTTGSQPQRVILSADGMTAYSTAYGSNQLAIMNAKTGGMTYVTVGTAPYGLALSPDGQTIWVSNFNAHTVSRVNLSTKSVDATINVGDHPADVIATPDGRWVYVANYYASTISKINAMTNTVVSTLTTGLSPTNLALAPDASAIYVTNQSAATLSKILISTDSITSVSVGNAPRMITITPDGRFVYVGNSTSNNVSKYNVATGQVTNIALPGAASPYGITSSWDSAYIYVANYGTTTYSRIAVLGDTVTTSGGMPGSVSSPILSKDNNYLFLANLTLPQIYKVKLSDGTVTTLTDLDGHSANTTSQVPAISADGRAIYFAGAGGQSITQIIVSGAPVFLSSPYQPAGNATLLAQWSPNTYTITYDSNGATSGSPSRLSDTFTVGSSALTLPLVGTMVRTGYTFGGWARTRTGPSIGLTETSTTSDETLYAVWTPNPYTITFNSNYGTPSTKTESITAGVEVTLDPNTFARSGYSFSGWDDTSTGTGTDYTDGQAVTFYSNKTMYAQWTLRKPDAPTVTSVTAGNDSVTVTVAPVVQNCSQFISGPGTVVVDTTTAPGYCIYKITVGAETLTVPSGVSNIEVFAVAGGGGGGWGANAGGGGGGGIIYNPSMSVTPGSTLQLQVGAGGAGNGSGNGATGESTTVGTFVAMGGGGGSATWGSAGLLGGSSGGTSGTILNGSACGSNPSRAAGQYSYSGWTTYGNAGGGGCLVGGTLQGGGGGGATSAGTNTGAPGSGLVSAISGTSVTYSAGGRGYGGIQGNSAGSAGSANTGTGGGPAANGGSGYLFLKFVDQTGGAPTGETITALDASGAALSPAKSCYIATGAGSCVITGLANNTTYKFVSSASNISGSSANSAAVSGTPLPWLVTYSPESGTVSPATDNFNYPFANSLPTPIRAGYTFVGWYDTRTSGTLIGQGGDSYTVTRATTFYARWVPVTYTIRYDSNTASGGSVPAQGSFVTGGSAYVIVGNTGSLTKPGYTFGGWNTAANGSGTTYAIGFQDTATINIVLYAQWTPIAYSVTYALNGGSGTTPTQSAVNYQQQFTLASISGITRTGYTFAGWSDSTTTYLAGAIYTAGLSNIVLTAQWTVNKYLVTYDPNGATGRATDTSTLYTYGTSALTLTTVGTMVKTGYSFAGWSTTNNGSVISGTYTPTGPITLYAIWSANNYTVVFSSNYGTPSTSNETITAGTPKALNANAFTHSGFTFSNWSVDTSGVGTTYTDSQVVTLFGNLNLYAQWTIAKPDTPTVSAVTTGNESATVTVSSAGTGGAPTSYIVTAQPGGATCSITAPATSCSIAGLTNGTPYTFKAVAINSSGTSGSSYSSSAVTPRPFTVSYNPGDGATSDTSTDNYSVGDPLTLPGATKAGYTFAGWFTASSGGSLIGPAGAAYSPTDSITLYAQWTGIAYTITYNANGADTGTAPASGTYVNGGSAYSIAGNSGSLVRAGYTFVGWNTASSGLGTNYAASASYSTGASLSLYAKWSAAPLSLTYVANGGTGTLPNVATKYVGDSFTVVASNVLTKAGSNFAGWTDGRNTYTGGAVYTMGTRSETLTAVWVGIINTVTYDLNFAGAPANPTEANHAVNDTFTVAAGGTRTGYNFAGWNDGSNTYQAGATYTVGSSNILLTAQWTIKSFTITYDTSTASGGAVTRASDTFAYGSQPISLPQLGTIIKPGYSFAGWATSQGGSPIIGAFTPSASTTLYVVWKANTYTITYDGNSGSAPDTATVLYTSGTGGITLQPQGTMTRFGYTFGGWSTTANGSSPVSNGFAPTIDSTLYAIWNIITSNVTYYIGSGGGSQTATLPAIRSLGYNSTFTVDTFTSTDTGFAFAGWNDGNTTYGPGSTYRMGASSISLTAQWIAIFTVHYTLNGGTPAINDALEFDGSQINLASAPTKYGYDFQGWLDQLDPAQPTLAANSAYTVGITHYLLSAVWSAKTIHLTFDTGTTTSITTSYGSTITMPVAPTKAGYLFKNWSSGGSTYGAGASVLIGANDIAFTAQWTPVKYFIYFDLNLGRSDTLIVDIDPFVGETITLTSVAPIRAGYTFLGWSDGVTTPPNGQIYWMPGDIYTQPAGNVTLTAQFSPNSYSVTYLLNGAPGSAPTQSAVLTGGTFALASAPTWTNYSFVGWSDGTNTLAAGSTYTVVADTVTLTAQWVSTLFTASYSLNGGTGTIPATVNLNTGETFTVAAYSGFSKAGYDFAGWSDGSNVRTNPYVITMGTTNIALTAQWTLQVPGKPGNPIITPGNGSASIQVVAPSTGGTPTSYVVTASPGGATCTVVSPATSCVISPLTNGTQYSFTVQAINSAGSSTSSDAVTSTPATVSGAPTNVVAVAGNTSATISFTAPASNGGSTITSYTVTASTGQSATGTSSPITISGLTNGTSETFTVTATNGIGTSAPSTASGSVTPATTPGAPSISDASVSGGAATIVFNAPSSNGGSAITSYTVISSPGGLTATGSTSPIVVPGLVTGTPYTFTVVANNAMGAGTPSAPSSTLVSALKPDAPPAPTAVAGNGQATITFAAPASNGGATITSYTVTASPGGETSTVSSGTTATVTGLTNGQAYTFTVTATNAIGTSFSSLASNSVTPIAPSTAPLNVSALAAPGSATISFDTPTSTGGSPITGYIITPSPATSPATFTTTTSPVTIAGLTNGTAYTFTVKAVNAAGQSVASLPSASVTPATTPDTPTAVIATPMDGGASVAFTAPAANGSLITSYTVTASNGATASGVSSPIIFSGLTNGTAYTFVVTATNGVGLSDTSLPSAAITPANIPSAPTISTVTAGLSAATITVVSGGSGGSAITSYVVTAAPGGATCTVYAPADSCTIAPLTPGTSYYFTAVAINAVGQSLPSSASASVTPINVPGTPTSLLAAPSDGAASISFTAPTSNGSPIIEYIATNTSTGETFTATSSPIAVSGLTNGTPTTFSIVAVNAAGASIAASVTTTSRTVAGAPSITGVSGGSGTATISVGAPSSNGGSAITSYIVTASPGGASCVVTSPATSCTISGLINGTTYTFSAAATNAAGTGNSSAPSGGFTPASAPSAPTNVSAVAGAGNATVSFAPPSLNGGSAVTSYTVTSSPSGGSCTVSAPATSCIVSGLTNGIAYTFDVVAANGVGSSSAATTNSVTPLDVPTAPRTPVATPTDGGAVVTFTAPTSNGGATILYYTVTAYPGSITEVVSGTTATFTGLNNGTAYTFDVVATNSEGDSTASVATSAVTPRALTAAPDARFDLTENISYTVDVSAIGGTNPKVYALLSPAVLPVGMTLDANTGIISGIPTVAGTYVETVTATDATGASVTTVATIQVTASNSQSNNGGGEYLVISPVSPPAAVPAPATGGGGGAPASAPGPLAPIPAEPIPNPEPKPTPAKPVAPSISQQVSQVLATATVIRVPATTPVELPAATGAPAKVMTVASMSGTSLAVIITPTGTPPTSYVITITNSVTGEVKTQNVNGASITQSIPISGLSPTGLYTVSVVANTASGQALSVAGKVATPAAVTAPYSKLTSAAIISANAATSKITTVFPLSSSVSASLNGVNTSLASGVLASTSADGTALAMTILPPSKSAAINSYVVMVTDRTTGIVTTQTIPAGSTPSSMALAGLAPGDNYSVAVIASNKDGSQTLVLSNAIKMAGVSAGPAKPGVVVLKQTAGTTDSANSPKIVKVVPKLDSKNRNKATVEIGNLKPGQRIKVTVKGKK